MLNPKLYSNQDVIQFTEKEMEKMINHLYKNRGLDKDQAFQVIMDIIVALMTKRRESNEG